MVTLRNIRKLAFEAEIGYGELMRLARECEEDATLPSLAHLSTRGREQLSQTLFTIRLQRSVRLKARCVIAA